MTGAARDDRDVGIASTLGRLAAMAESGMRHVGAAYWDVEAATWVYLDPSADEANGEVQAP